MTIAVGEWAHQRTKALMDQFRSADNRPLEDIGVPGLGRLDDKAKNTLMLLRSHLAFCKRQAVPGHPHAFASADDTIDLRSVDLAQVQAEIETAIDHVIERRTSIAQRKQLLLLPESQRSGSASVVVANPQTAHTNVTTEQRILNLEQRRRNGELTISEYANALRAVLLSKRP